MNKRRLHHVWRIYRRVHPLYFLALTILFGIISFGALRANNEHMLGLREDVEKADQSGVGVQESLKALQLYVTSHMNTKLNFGSNPVYPPIQLKYTYDRLVRAESDKVVQANQAQYNDAIGHCPSSGDSYGDHLNQQNCVISYMQDKHNVTVPSIPDALYKFDFASPSWSPDMAGWGIVLTAFSALSFVFLFLSRLWFKKVVS